MKQKKGKIRSFAKRLTWGIALTQLVVMAHHTGSVAGHHQPPCADRRLPWTAEQSDDPTMLTIQYKK